MALKKIHLENRKKDKTINEYVSLISEIRKEYNTFFKENQDLKTKMQKLRNYYDREKLISQNKKAMRNFPSRSLREKSDIKDLMKAAAMKKQTMKKNIMLIQKRKNQEKKYYDDIDDDYDDIDGDIEDYAGE